MGTDRRCHKPASGHAEARVAIIPFGRHIAVWCALLLATGVTGCASLKEVNDFSSASLATLTAYETIGSSFTGVCAENCDDARLIALNLNGGACDCSAEAKADSATTVIYDAVKGYLSGLTGLSADDVTTYRLEPIERGLNSLNGRIVTITEKEADAYSDIAKILFRATADRYRQSKLREYVKEGNAPVKVLLHFLDFNVAHNLTGKLNVRKERLKAEYFDLVTDSSLSTFEKRKAVAEYYRRIAALEKKQDRIAAYSQGLNSIMEGHQQLYDNIDKLDLARIKEQLTRYANDIQGIASEINKLKE